MDVAIADSDFAIAGVVAAAFFSCSSICLLLMLLLVGTFFIISHRNKKSLEEKCAAYIDDIVAEIFGEVSPVGDSELEIVVEGALSGEDVCAVKDELVVVILQNVVGAVTNPHIPKLKKG